MAAAMAPDMHHETEFATRGEFPSADCEGEKFMTNRRAAGSRADRQYAGGGMTRRRWLKLGVASGAMMMGSMIAPSVITPARGAERNIKIGMYSNPRTELIKATVIKRLEEEHRVKFLVDEGWTTEQLARLRASRNNPVHTVMWMDDIGVNIARKEGLIDRLPEDKIPNLAKVFPRFFIEQGYGVGIDASTVALTYSTRELKEPPTSWTAFWDRSYRGKISVPSVSGTHGLFLVILASALETGKPFREAQYEPDAAFKKLAELKPNLHSIFSKNALVMAALQQGEVVMTGPFYSGNIWPYIDKGLEAHHIIPQEGGFAGLPCQTLVHGGPYPELGAAFINAILEPETQAMMAKNLSNSPVVRGVQLPPETLARVNYDENKETSLFLPDWEFINTVRAEWTERWNKTFT
jgi:putative spermidine/putrescine transport system substrate-binding protein